VAEIKVVDEPVTVVVSQKGWVRALKGHEPSIAATLQPSRPAMRFTAPLPAAASTPLLVFGTAAKWQRARVQRGGEQRCPAGAATASRITTLIDLESGTQVAHYFAGAADTTLLLANTGGFGLLAKAGDLHGRNKGGQAAS
jgi:topoisomerase IV subunit A